MKEKKNFGILEKKIFFQKIKIFCKRLDVPLYHVDVDSTPDVPSQSAKI